ncbi:MAG TPA: ubiquitin-like small modifier protein 1 [Pyrinomonadaceae bacterium]|jgi:adenylyltransferase/sulfurtransferase
MAVKIIIPTALRQFADGSAQLELDANKVGEALDGLTSRYTALRKHLYNDQNALRSFVNVYVNDEDIRHAQVLDTPVRDGDTVMIVPSIAGGCQNH